MNLVSPSQALLSLVQETTAGFEFASAAGTSRGAFTAPLLLQGMLQVIWPRSFLRFSRLCPSARLRSAGIAHYLTGLVS